MAAKFLVKRSSVTGQAPNTSQISTGELALNLTDGIMYGSNGSVIFEIGANLSSLSVNSISFPTTDGTNGQVLVTNGSGGLSFANPSGGANVQIVTGIQYDTFKFSITSNTTVLSGQDDDGVILFYSAGSEDVYQNGLKLIAGDDYTQTDSGTITLTSNAVSGDTIEILNIVGHSTINEFTYTVSANQTIFTGNDDNLNLLGYTLGREMVYVNGVKLIHTDDYTTPNSTHIILTANAVSGDVVEVVSFERGNGDIVTDSSPQLGGFLDLNNNDITGTGNININGSITAGNSTVNAVIASSGNIDTDGTLTVAGQALFNGSTTVNNTFVANGATTIANTLAAGNTTITGFANISSNLTVSSVATFGSDVTVSGNLVVTGTRIFANTTTVDLGDNIITLNADIASNIAPSENSGIEVNRGSGSNVSLLWNETSDTWTLTNDGSTYYDIATNNFVTSTYAPLASPAFTGNANFDTDVLFIDSVNDRVGLKTTTPGVTLDVSSAVDAFHLPSGNTAQRPSGSGGMLRFNTDTSKFEIYTTSWGDLDSGTSTFTTDSFTANGSQTAFTLSQTPTDENSLIIFNEGVFQNQDAYTLSGNTVTFDTAPGTGNKIVAYSVKAAVSGSNLNQDTYTANGTQTAFTLTVNPIDERNTQVFIDGVYQQKDAYTVSGTTLTFGAAPANGTTVEVMTFTQTSINVPTSNSINSTMIQNGQIVSAALANSISTNNITVNQDLTVTSNAIFNGNVALGSNSSDIVSVNGLVNTHIIPSANITYDLGSTTNRFRDLYLSGTSIKLGDQTISANATHFSIGTAELSSANGMLYARQEDIDTAVANLVASAPSTLDTLNEIAAALGSDPDLANTLTTSIATKAPLANPTFSTTIQVSNDLEFITGFNPRIDFDAGSSGSLRFFSTSTSSERARFTSGGSFGLGTTNPQNRLHVTDSDVQIELEATSGAANNSGFIDFDGTNLQLSTSRDMKTGSFRDSAKSWAGMSLIGAAGGSEVRFYTSTSSGSAASQRMTIDQSGNVGIGNTTPASKLHVQGGVRATDLIAHDSSGINLQTDEGTKRLVVDDAGYVVINDDVTYGANAPTHRGSLVLAGASGFANYGGLEFHTSSGGGAGYGTRIVSSDASLFFGRRFNAAGWTESLRIDNDGNIGVGPGVAPSFTSFSGVLDSIGMEIQNGNNDSAAHLKLSGRNNTGTPGQVTSFEIAHRGDALKTSMRHGGLAVLDFNSSGHAHFASDNAASTQLYIGAQGGAFGGNSSHNMRAAGSAYMFNAGGTSGSYIFECNGANKLGIANTGVATHQSSPSGDSYTLRVSTTNSADPGLSIWRSGQVGFGIAVRNATTNYADFLVSSGGEPTYTSAGNLRIYQTGHLNMPGDHVYNSTNGFEILAPSGRIFQTFNYNSASAEVFIQNNRTAGGTVAAFEYRINNSTASGGTIFASTSGYTGGNFSDYRLKNNVTNLTGSLDKINQLRAVSYNHVDTPDKTELGFIAHEIAEVFPEFVHGEKDALWTQEDIDNYEGYLPDVKAGDIKAQKVEYFSKEWTTHILLAIKELKQENDELKARIEALENA